MPPKRDSKGRFVARDSMADFTASMAAYRDGPFSGVSGYSKDAPYMAYRNSWLAKMAIEGLPEDCFKKGYQWAADKDQITLIESVERKHKIKDKKKRALISANKDGEAYLYFDTGDNSASELDADRVGVDGIKFVNVFAKTQLRKGSVIRDPLSPYFGQPEKYTISAGEGSRMVDIHPSRICRVISNPDPDTGDGLGVLPFLSGPISDAETARSNTVALTTEALIDVVGSKCLFTNLEDPDGARALSERYNMMRSQKRTNAMLIFDLEEESYDRKPATFTTLPEIIETMRREVAAAMGRPYALIWGREGGLGTNGDMELSTYYDEVAAYQRNVLQPTFESLDDSVIRSALGSRPEEIYIDWLSLWETSDKEKAEIASTTATAARTLVDGGIVPAEVLTAPVVNSLVELGAFQGIDQEYSDWVAAGGDLEDEPDVEESEDGNRSA